jgi:prepilin-type N-terminal cleavage/methylation domain-containing protein
MPSKKGFTLIEVIIATLLLTVALLGLAAVTSTVIRGNSFSQTLTLATTLAKDKMEETKGTIYDNLNTGATTDYANSDGSAAGGSTGSFYTRTLTIGAAANNVKTVSVTVTWNWLRLGHTVTLNTLRAKRN